MSNTLLMSDPLVRTYLKLLEDVDSPRSLALYILVKSEDWGSLLDFKCDPLHYRHDLYVDNVERFRHDYQATVFLQKNDSLPTGIDRRKVAVNGFWEAERQCASTNARLLDLLLNDSSGLPQDQLGAIHNFVDRVKKIVSATLGPVPNQIEPRFGPGSIYESKGYAYSRSLTLLDKVDKITPSVTAKAKDIFSHYFWPSAWGRTFLAKQSSDLNVIFANRFTTVPKDATKDRGICVEPGGNVWLQLGVGKHIRRRLRDILGLLLDDGRSETVHARLAKVGSVTEEYATIDLKSASDTVARNLVKLFLPQPWFELLDALRVPKTQIEGKTVLLEKFSSMGNGFTFELETLIFAAISKAVIDVNHPGGLWSVYGDDIIVPTDCADDVIGALRFFGFTPNKKKTFLSGLFRESCGNDYFSGVNVRPYFCKEYPNEPQRWINIANGLYRASSYTAHATGPLRIARLRALEQLPKAIRQCEGPVWLGDITIHCPSPKGRVIDGVDSYRCYVPVFNHRPLHLFSPDAVLAYALLGGDSDGPVPRGDPGIRGYRVAWTVEKQPYVSPPPTKPPKRVSAWVDLFLANQSAREKIRNRKDSVKVQEACYLD